VPDACENISAGIFKWDAGQQSVCKLRADGQDKYIVEFGQVQVVVLFDALTGLSGGAEAGLGWMRAVDGDDKDPCAAGAIDRIREVGSHSVHRHAYR
jgi:hypothetical protein